MGSEMCIRDRCVVVGGSAGLWGVMFLVLPGAVGRSLLGDTWTGVSAILGAAVVGQVVQTLGAGPAVMLQAMDRVPVTFALSAIECPLAFVLGVVGAVVGGAEGAIWGFAIAYAVMTPFWWVRMHREARRLVAARPGEEAPSGSHQPAPTASAAGGDDVGD